ncbi:MAG: class I SAM-dependent methyltransferase [Oligoflexia bacterium]|nr:class I SAM-dependent methyltransferase [Oligoflexia bacterium]
MKMKDKSQNTEHEVQEANRKFYDSTANSYDEIDTRRKMAWYPWLHKILKEIRKEISEPKAIIADAGAGSGFLLNHANDIFEEKIAIDISTAMLDQIKLTGCKKLLGACENLPLENNSVDLVTAFATLHHIHSPEKVFQEAFRVLRPNGFFYSDHDIETKFISNWKIPLKIYRSFFDHEKSYLEKNPNLNHQDYSLTEFHGNSGISGQDSLKKLTELGFTNIRINFHWQGLLPIEFPWKIRGLSPILRIIAQKRH